MHDRAHNQCENLQVDERLRLIDLESVQSMAGLKLVILFFPFHTLCPVLARSDSELPFPMVRHRPSPFGWLELKNLGSLHEPRRTDQSTDQDSVTSLEMN